MAIPPAAPPVPVVLPLLGDPVALLDAVSVLAARWPSDVDAQLVVPTGPLSRRDRGLLESLGEDVRIVETSAASPTFGALVAAVAGATPLVVLDPAALPGAGPLSALAAGTPADGGLLLDPACFASAPVLTAARDLRALGALLTTLDAPTQDAPSPAEAVTPLVPPDGPVRAGTVSVVVPVRDRLAQTQACLAALRRSTRTPHQVVVVDDGSTDGTRAWLATQRDLVVVTSGEQRGQAAAWNQGVAASHGDTVVLLDPDTVVPRFWLEGLLRVLGSTPGAGAVGPRLVGAGGAQDVRDADYADLGAYRTWADAWRRTHAGTSSEVRRLAASCVAVRRDVLVDVRGLDEGYRGPDLAVDDLLDRLRRRGLSLHVAHDVAVHTSGTPRTAPAADAVHLQAQRRRRGEPSLSAALIVKDEQAALPACLASLRGTVDELVVCDTGSSDRTVEIAQAFGARVVHAPWTGDFAAARNAVLDHCRGLWVLSIDADEQLQRQPDADLALEALAHTRTALSIRIRSRSSVEGGPSFEHAAGRLFRREELRWEGAVHETLVDATTGRLPVYSPVTGAWLEHDGYLEDVYQERDKGVRNLQLAEKDHEQSLASGDRARLWKTAYELARALSKHAGDEERVERLLLEALDGMPPGLTHLRCDAHVRLATAYVRLGRLVDAEASARAAASASPSDPAARLVLAQLLAGDGRPEEALALVEPTPAQDGVAAVLDLGKAVVDLPLLRARLLHALGRTPEAAVVLQELAQDQLAHMDWPLLHACLRDRPETLAGLVARDPEPALAALDGLAADDRDALHRALALLGTDADAHSPAAVRARRLDGVLHGHDPELVAQAALALEDTDLESALDLWARSGDTPAVRVAQARCLLQLGRTEDAVTAVEGLDVAALPAEDLLVVTAVAAAAGDLGTAQALLEHADRTCPPELDTTVAALAQTLGLALPDRVHQGP